MLDRTKFFGLIRNGPFPGSLTEGQIQGTNTLLDAWDSSGLTDDRFLAYMLATTFHETAHTMQPIEEYGKGRGRPYGVPTGPFHQVYYGRGDVQLTWERNYIHATQQLRAHGVIGDDIDLDKTPTLAMRPDIAAAILIWGMVEGWFTGKKLGDYFTGTPDPGFTAQVGVISDWFNARRIINGIDRAQLIAGYGRQFFADLQASRENK